MSARSTTLKKSTFSVLLISSESNTEKLSYLLAGATLPSIQVTPIEFLEICMNVSPSSITSFLDWAASKEAPSNDVRGWEYFGIR